MKKSNATKTNTITAEEFDRRFDNGEDVSEYFDWSKARRPGLEVKRVNVDFPSSILNKLDREAQRIGVTRQSLIKVWIAERLEQHEPVVAAKGAVSPSK